MALASSEELASWLRANADKRGTPDYQTVLRGFQEAVIAESRAASAAPAAPAGPKESTIFGEIARGGKQLFSTSRTGIGALATPEEAARAGVERSQQIAAEAGEGPSLAALRKVYEERGLLPAAGELASQIPRAVAGQLPQLAALAGGAKLGAMAGTAVLPGPGTIAGGILGAGATLLPQFFGANVERQAAEQMERGEPISIDRGTAAAAAAGQAGIESVGTALVLGKRMVKGILGVADDAGLATAKARADLVKAAERSRLGAAGRGAAVGLAEIPVEVAQAVIERAQAGLDVMSPEAFTEYGENAYLAGLVGPTLGAATRVTAPGAARKKLAAEEQVKAGETRKAAQAAEEAKKKSPEYLLDLDTNYQAAVERMKELQAAVPKRPAKDALPEEQMAYKAAVEARNTHLKDVLQPLAAEYVPRKAEIAQLKERLRVEGMSPLDYMLEQTETAPIKGIAPGERAPTTVEDTEIFPTIRPTAPALAYAQQRIQLANEQAFADSAELKEQAATYAQYLLQDPAMARQLAATKPNIPALTAKQNTAVYKQLAELLKQQTQQQVEDIETEGLNTREFTYEEQALEDARRLREEEAFADEERMREEEAMAVEPVRKEEAVISPEREEQIKALDTARKRYLAAADTYQKAKGTPDGARALQQLLAARKEYDSFSTTPMGGQAPRPVLSPETETQLDKALTEVAGVAPASVEELESRIQRLSDTRKTAIAKVSENASELAQYEKLTQYMGTPQGLSEIARTPEMAEAAKRRMTPMVEQAQASRNEAIAAAIQEIRLQRDASGLVPLGKTDAELQTEFREKLNKDLQKVGKGKTNVNEAQRQQAITQQLQRINSRIRQLETGDRAGRLLGYASAFRTEPERIGELNNLYKAYRSLSMQQGLTPQAAQLNRTLQNLVDFYTVGSGAAKPKVVAKGPREAKRELVLGERAFTGYEPTVEGTEVRYEKPRKMAEYQATPEEQALVEDMRARELAELNEAADRQYTPETSDRVKKQIFDALRARIEGLNTPATQEEVDAAQAQAAPQDQGTGDLFAAATERAQAEFQAAGERRTAARSEMGRAMAGMRGKSAIMDQAQRLAEKFGKDLGLEGTFAAAKQRLTQAQTEKRAAETEFTEKEQEALRAAADDALIAQRDAEAANRAANNTVEAITARLEAEKETPAVEVRTPPRAAVLLRKIVELQSLLGGERLQKADAAKQGLTPFSPTRFISRPNKAEASERDVGSVQDALNQALSAVQQGETWASDIEQVQAHMATLEKYLSRREAQGRLLPQAELMAKEWYRKLAAHEAALRRPMYGAGQLTPAEIRDYTQRRLEMAQAEYDRIKLQIDGLHRQLLDTEVAVAKREVDRITAEINALVSRMERREGADLANQELTALTAQHKDAVANLDAAQKIFEERKKAESVPFTRKSPASALEQWMKGAQDRFEQSVQRFKDKQKALERQATAPAATPATTAAERRAETQKERGAPPLPVLEMRLKDALDAQTELKKRGSKKQRAALAEKIAGLREQIRLAKGESTFGTEYYEEAAQEDETQAEAEAREAGKEETTRAGRRKAAKEIFGVQRTIAETGKVPQAEKDGEKLENVIKNNRQAFEMAVEQGFKSTAIRPQKRGKSATPERLMRTPLEAIAYRLRQEIVEKLGAPQTKQQKKELNKLREHLYGLEEAINTAPVTVEERRRTARAIWAKLPEDMRNSVVDTFKGRTESGSISIGFFDRLADALETTVIRQRLGEPLGQAPVTTMTKAELAPIQAETEKRVAATMKATEELRTKYYEQKEKELADKARLKGAIDEATQKRIEKEANEFADRVVQRFEEEKAREATRRMTEPMRGKPAAEDLEFSRGPTESPSTTDSVRTELKKAFPDLGRVQIYDSVDALIAANPQYEGRIPSDARGFVDTAGNKAFLIAENIDKGDALAVLLHEVGAHIGLKNLLGTAQYNALVKAVETWAKKNDGSIESRVAKAAQARVEAAKTPANQKDDETLAYAIEEAVKAGVKPMETKGVLGHWLSQIATLFRKALEKFGLPPKALDAQGIVDLAFGAAQMEMGFSVPKGEPSRIDTYEEAKKNDARLLKQVEQFLLTGTPVPAPTTLYRGGTAVGQAYTHATPWAAVAAKAGKLLGYDPKKPERIYEYKAAKDQKYYRGGALEGDPLETTRIHNAKGMTWDQALAAAKKLFDAEVRALPERYTNAYLANPENKQDAIEGIAGQVTEDFFNAVYETDATNKPGVWTNKKVPEELMQDTPKLRAADSKGDLLFTYAGERSGIAAEALKEAKEMTAQGAPMEEVWNKTGWFQSADKKWRFEIDDSKAKFRFDDYYEALKNGTLNTESQAELKLSNILWHPRLYKAYPALKDLPVKLYDNPNDSVLGSFDRDKKELTLNLTSLDAEGVLLHEVQHYIQSQEGFKRGSNTTDEYMRTYKTKVLQSVRESYARMVDTADAFDGSKRSYYQERVTAMDAGIAAAEKARSERAKTIADARKEQQKDKKEIADAMVSLRAEYELLRDKHNAALDAQSAAHNKFVKAAKSKTATTAEKDAAWSELQKADAALLSAPRPKLAEYLAEHDKLIDRQSAAYKKYVDVTYATRKDLYDAIDTAIKAKLPSQSVFAAFARIGISQQAYENVLGEVEARDVEERRKLTAKERAATRPYSSQPQRREEILFSRNLPTAARVADQIIGKQPTVIDNIKKNLFGLAFRTQVIDALAPLEQIANTSMDALKGAQMMYYLRKYGMRNHMTEEAVENGVAQVKEVTRPDGQKERIIEAVSGANIKDIVKRLAAKDVVKEAGSADAANRLFTLYISAIRGENKGYDKLNFGRAAAQSELQQIERELASPKLEPQDKARLNARKAYLEKNIDGMPTEADFRAAKAEIEANPTLKAAFDEARGMYNEYNTDLLNFLVQTGAVSKDEAARLLRAKDYVPYYRMRGGNAELMIGGETPIRIGNLKDSPHLQELVGGEEPIFDFLTSSVQNTSLLLDMGLRNIAAKNVAYELADAGLASKPARAGKTGAPKGTLEFKLDGEDFFVRVDTDYIGVPSDLLVKGMAGIPTMLPQGLRLMGIPAQILRRAVTSTPVFAAKQLFRDSLGAYMLSGSDAPPLLSAVNQLRKASPLKARGVTGGQTFTGTTEDISRLLKEMQEGRPGWMKAFSKMEAMAHKADAATRQSQYESYRAQGLSDMEAELMSLESMNFSKRGLSPTMHMASMLVPFLNAQIQGLDVLYKAMTGKMPFNDKLDIQRKLFTRGASMFVLTMAYAAAMQDDEEYKNAQPDVKYGNWFVRLPFLDEVAGEKVTLRVPIPFEVGYIFKALPEMLYNSMKSDQGAKEAFTALNHILIQIVPGGSSMVPIEIGGAKIPVPVPIPAAMKPVIEVGLGKSFFTGRDLESAREQQEVPGMRYREKTSEIAKYIGASVNFSPIKIEALVNGYTGGLGLLALQALSLPLPKASVEVPEKRWSELPLVGPMFQPADASNVIDGMYKDFQKVTQAKTTYDNLLVKGETGKAQAFLQENLQLIMLNQMAGQYRQIMGDLTKDERIIRGSNLTAEEKRKLVDQIKAAKIQIAESVRAVVDRKTPQAALA